ncbi:MAG: hypothetical protein K2H86_05845 [Muribaculaceae bacterium]|nr:hypothetical protein [Muribaculaceae bacterium]
MKELGKVNSLQLYSFWKQLSYGFLAVIALIVLSGLLPFYVAPILSTICAVSLYLLIYNARFNDNQSCNLSLYALFWCVTNYTVISIILNLVQMFNIVELPKEFVFMTDPYLPTLILHPICFLTILLMYLRRRDLKICRDCKLKTGGLYERGRAGKIFRYESYYQLRNMLLVFGILSLAVWSYYLWVYLPMNVSARDWYVFKWLTVIVFVFDEVYFIYRYYNLYLDLKESDSIISQDDLNNMSAKTYLRYYVICGDKIFMDPHAVMPGESYREVLESPFVTKRAVNGISVPEVRRIIEGMTGAKNGELRFFYGRKSTDLKNSSILRYFYFLDGNPEDYNIAVDGAWVDFDLVKKLYSKSPGRISPMCVADLTRLATIMLTEKIFDKNGYRKSKVKSYRPSFTLEDVRESDLDFQDDQWIKISLFNSDRKFYSLRRWWRNHMSRRPVSDTSNRTQFNN